VVQVKRGDVVEIHYTGRLRDGTVFDSSEGRDPLSFEAGSQELIPGVSEAVIGMSDGEEKTVQVAPAEGYGERREDLVQEVPLQSLPDGVKEGDALQARAGERVIPVWVRAVNDESATVDANHPLAGKDLEFDIRVVSIGSGT